MDKELRGLVFEIIAIAIMLVIVVPICVNASGRYREQKEALLEGVGTSVDISHEGDMKKVTVYSGNNNPVRVNLVLRINKIVNNYDIYFEENVYNIKDLECVEDEQYRYYRLGIYEIDEEREFSFKIVAKDSNYYNETIVYSFLTEGLE